MSHTYDVIVVGAGPAGIFTALELTGKMPDAKLLLIDSACTSTTAPARRASCTAASTATPATS